MVTHFLASTYDASSLPIPGINHAVAKGDRECEIPGRRRRVAEAVDRGKWPPHVAPVADRLPERRSRVGQVRSGLSAGANEIRTRGPTAVASSVSGPCWSISSRARPTHSHDGCGVRTTLVPQSNRRSPCQPAPELPSGPNPISTHGHGAARQAAGGSCPPRDRRPDRP